MFLQVYVSYSVHRGWVSLVPCHFWGISFGVGNPEGLPLWKEYPQEDFPPLGELPSGRTFPLEVLPTTPRGIVATLERFGRTMGCCLVLVLKFTFP